jgi:sensor domain CHASE-containing protein
MLVVAGTLVVLIGVLALTLSNVMRSGFAKIEQDDARKNVSRVRDAVQAQLGGIENSVFTWTQWDPAYRFVEDRNPQFLAENMGPTVFTGMKIDFCVFVNLKREVVYAGGYDAAQSRDLPVPAELLQLIREPGSAWLANTDPTAAVRGIAMVGTTPLLVVAAPVTNTDATAPAKGHLIFARVLGAAEVQRIGATTHLQFALDSNVRSDSGISVEVRDQDIIQGITNLTDVTGRPVQRMVVDIPREVDRQARHSLRLLLLSIVAIGVIFGVVMYVVITWLVLQRVLAVSKTVAEMTDTLDFSKRVQVSGKDEISALADSVNGMACAVSEVLALQNPAPPAGH